MTTFEDKMALRRYQATRHDNVMDLVSQELWVLDDLIPCETQEEVMAATHQLEDVAMILHAVRRNFNRMVNSWFDEDVRDHWPPDDFHLPDWAGS